MKTKWLCFIIALTTIIIGCKENPIETKKAQPDEITEQEALAEIISNDELLTADQALLDDGESPNSSSLKKGESAIIPLKWGRKIVSASRTNNFTKLTDSTATATITHTLTGFIWIKQSDTTASIIKKNFTEKTERIVKFVRINRLKDKRLNWKISEVSAMKGGTETVGIQVQKAMFFIGNDTLQITDPLNYFLKIGKNGIGGMRSIPRTFTDSLKVRVELISVDPDSDIVSVHRPYYLNLTRMFRSPMKLISATPTSDGKFLRVYENSWKGVWTGRHHVIIGAMTRESIFDDVKPFNSELWGIPFIVE